VTNARIGRRQAGRRPTSALNPTGHQRGDAKHHHDREPARRPRQLDDRDVPEQRPWAGQVRIHTANPQERAGGQKREAYRNREWRPGTRHRPNAATAMTPSATNGIDATFSR
jgi:hypothetical protein